MHAIISSYEFLSHSLYKTAVEVKPGIAYGSKPSFS